MTGDTRDRLVAVGLAAGYLMLLAETLLAHWPVIPEEPITATGPAAALVMLIFSGVACLTWRPAWRRAWRVASLAVVLVGLAGVGFHLEEAAEAGLRTTRWQIPPVLAPLAFCGLGAFGALLNWPLAGASEGSDD